MEFPDRLAENTILLDDQLTDSVSREAIMALQAKGFVVHMGLSASYADALIAMAQEPAIREYCPNDALVRFRDRAAIEEWLRKHRAVFLLLKQTPDGLQLAGYGWSGTETTERVPDGQTTFALRVGELGQGQGLSTPFAQLILNATQYLYGSRNLWLETWASNAAAVHVYQKLGFQQVDEVAAERASAGGTVPDTRLFMTLGR